MILSIALFYIQNKAIDFFNLIVQANKLCLICILPHNFYFYSSLKWLIVAVFFSKIFLETFLVF